VETGRKDGGDPVDKCIIIIIIIIIIILEFGMGEENLHHLEGAALMSLHSIASAFEKRCLGQQDGPRGHCNAERTLQEMALPVLSTDALILARRSPAMRCGVTGRGASLPLLSRGKKFDILWGDRSL
jgi:hypothetical protein